LLGVEFTKAGWTVKIADLDTAQARRRAGKRGAIKQGFQPEIAVEKFARLNGRCGKLNGSTC